ncbi:hypothetical protein [Peribacillus alkalitolerans]|uniref:hypothetical protein n=1 Tax=Peribacillus alkalitolerans TaxID=1550385 RepID=UPI0013D38BA1|nr:hypothetical protein [Peribacillus alkalitolerans]
MKRYPVEGFVVVIIIFIFFLGSWFLVKPAFKHIGEGVHQLNGELYIKATKNYLLIENVQIKDPSLVELTLRQLKEAGYVGTRKEMGLNLEIFSPPQHPYSDDSRIVIMKSNGQPQFFIRLCPYRVKVCTRDSETLLDTIPK